MTGEPCRRPAPAPEPERWRAITTRSGGLAGALTLRPRRLEPPDPL
ncbi:hypothetical protein AB0G15_22445 [Streptosporangium sp. NPDC023825]